jgi:hypothetical protein
MVGDVLMAGGFMVPELASKAIAEATSGCILRGRQHNLDAIHSYRAKAGAPALTLDPVLSRFAEAGAKELKQTHQPHGHFEHADVWNSGLTGGAAENHGDPPGAGRSAEA